MVNEHALTVRTTLSMEDITYMLKKANKLGISSRKISHVFSQIDEEGTHYYFEVEEMKPITRPHD